MNYSSVAFAVCVAAAFMLGITVDNRLKASDFDIGWTAGYAAREAAVQDDNKRFASLGMCVLASYACAPTGRTHK